MLCMPTHLNFGHEAMGCKVISYSKVEEVSEIVPFFFFGTLHGFCQYAKTMKTSCLVYLYKLDKKIQVFKKLKNCRICNLLPNNNFLPELLAARI